MLSCISEPSGGGATDVVIGMETHGIGRSLGGVTASKKHLRLVTADLVPYGIVEYGSRGTLDSTLATEPFRW